MKVNKTNQYLFAVVKLIIMKKETNARLFIKTFIVQNIWTGKRLTKKKAKLTCEPA